ncbi:hypothetical protein [Peribacillus frigoritolerans]|uniref:hypothetical protein n=1 Tax=Peribacillus frigoritolerans TaxID=450367 RepID=UPI003806A0ED
MANKKPHNSVLLWNSYSEGYNFKRILIEIIAPIVITILTILLIFLSDIKVTNILLKVKEMNSQVADIIAIQIGFNITCLALLASFSRDTLHDSFSKVQEGEKESVLRQLLSTFTYCVFVQTGIIFLGIIYNTVVDDLMNIEYLKMVNKNIQLILSYTFFLFWLSFILHSFMVFLRNVSLIHKFILVVFKTK